MPSLFLRMIRRMIRQNAWSFWVRNHLGGCLGFSAPMVQHVFKSAICWTWIELRSGRHTWDFLSSMYACCPQGLKAPAFVTTCLFMQFLHVRLQLRSSITVIVRSDLNIARTPSWSTGKYLFCGARRCFQCNVWQAPSCAEGEAFHCSCRYLAKMLDLHKKCVRASSSNDQSKKAQARLEQLQYYEKC